MAKRKPGNVSMAVESPRHPVDTLRACYYELTEKDARTQALKASINTVVIKLILDICQLKLQEKIGSKKDSKAS